MPTYLHRFLNIDAHHEVNKGNTKKQRGRGRPATGRDPVMAIRLSDELRAAVDHWAAVEKKTRSEAIRILIKKGLES